MKTCTKCNTEKELTQFSKDKYTKDDYTCWCRSCHKKYRDNNKDKISKHLKDYYLNNKEKIKIIHKNIISITKIK